MVHACGHARCISVPGHQVIGLLAFPHQVFAHASCPDQIAGVQELEGSCHLLAAQVALATGDVVQQPDLAFVNKQA